MEIPLNQKFRCHFDDHRPANVYLRDSFGRIGRVSLFQRWTRQVGPCADPGPREKSLIDVHHHFVPPFYLAENRDRIATASGGQIHPAWFSWTPERAITSMDKQGVATAVLSLTFPGIWFGDPQEAARTARRVNQYAADLARSHPGRFGRFAVIPFPDTEGSLREIEYALSVLKADGIGFLTSYGDKWLGDAAYQPVFEELNRRKAVVFVHPTTPLCCRTLLPDVAPVVAEIPQDTTRAVTNLLFTGTFARFKDIHFIFPTRVETCRWCSVVCTNMLPRISPKRHPTESTMSSSGSIRTSLVLPIDQRSRHSQIWSQPHIFCSGAIVRMCRSPRRPRACCKSVFRQPISSSSAEGQQIKDTLQWHYARLSREEPH